LPKLIRLQRWVAMVTDHDDRKHPEDEPGSLPGICNASFGIGGSLGFTWAGTVIGEGTRASYHAALWVAVVIGVAAFASSLILKPRTAKST